MPIDAVLPEPLAEKQLRLPGVEGMLHEANHVEVQLRERAAHFIETVLRLDDDFVEPVGQPPDFLLFGEGAKVPLTPPVRAGPSDPVIQPPAAIEFDDVFERGDEV